VLDKIQPIIDAVQWIIDKLAGLDFPDVPGFGRAVVGRSTGTTATASGPAVVEEHFHFYGITPADEDSLVRLIQRANVRARRTTGRSIVRTA
jgi:hypothetical protein